MNLKPTLLKTIVSIIIGLIIGNLIAWQQYVAPTNLVWRFIWGAFILFFIVSTVLTYVIWSLFQGKK